MSIRTTVTLDEDVLERVKAESRKRGAPFRDTLNDLLRLALLTQSEAPARKPFKVRAYHLGPPRPGINYDSVEAMLEYAEGPEHR
jgi:hypothetical protein